MEADNIPHKPNMDDIGRKNVDQEGAGHEVKILDNAIQVSNFKFWISNRPLLTNDLQYVHPNGVMVMSERIAQPSNKVCLPVHHERICCQSRDCTDTHNISSY